MVLNSSSQRALVSANQLLERGNLAGAEQLLTPLMSTRPDAQVLGVMGALRLRQNRLAEAESLFARAGAADPKEPAHAMNLARTRAAQGRVDDAIAAYRTAIKLNPALAPAYFELAALQQRAGRLQEAEATLRRLLRAMPDHAQAKLMLGMVLM